MGKIQLKTERGKLGLIRTNLAYAMIDAANSLLMDAEQDFKAEKLVLQRDVKQKLGLLIAAARQLKIRSRDFALDAYMARDGNDVENFCNDADFLARFLLTVVDRSGDDNTLFNQLYDQVCKTESRLKLI